MQSDLERDDLVMSLVESALEQPAESLEVFFSQVSQTHPGVIEEVRERVEWELRMGQFLRDPIVKREAPQPPPFRVGEVVNRRFEILRVVGEGGMGYVYEAQDTRLDRRVAIKCARGGFAGRLTPEARSALEVSHVNVCKMHELHTAETTQGPVDFLTMEFVDGETLYARIAREGPLRAAEAHEVARQICAGLEQAHKQGVVHGDLKTGNILLARSGDEPVRAVITDFGLARFQSGSSTDAAGGTPDYMAPELLSGSAATVASDIYAMGVLFSVMLTGQPARPDAVPRLPRRWGRVVSRCLAADPRKRYESAGKVTRDLSPARSVVTWVVSAAAIVLAVFSAYLWQNQAAPETPVRLVALPAVVEGKPFAAAPAVMEEVAQRLNGARRNFRIVPPSEAARQGVDSVAKARELMGATHVLTLRVEEVEGGETKASARVVDAVTGEAVRRLDGDYTVGEAAAFGKALIGTVTAAFRLRTNIPKESVSPAAYESYARGIALLRRDNYSASEAIPLFERATKIDSGSALPFAAMAECHMQKYGESGSEAALLSAVEMAAKARNLNPDAPAVLLISGFIQQQRGQYEAALRDYERAAQLDEGNSEAWRRLALVYEKLGRAPDAATMYQRSIDAQPGYFRTYLDLGNFYFARSDLKKAEGLFRKVVELAPVLPSGHINLGLTLLRQRRYEQAEQSLLSAVRLQPSAQVMVNLGAMYYLQGKFSEGLRWHEKALASGPPTALRYRNLADTFRQLGRGREALEAYQKAMRLAEADLALNPRFAGNRARMAYIAAHTGDRRRAELEATQALSIAPGDSQVLKEVALMHTALGQHDRALKVLQAASYELTEELGRLPDGRRLAATNEFQELLSSLKRANRKDD